MCSHSLFKSPEQSLEVNCDIFLNSLKNFAEICFPESGQPEVPLDRQFLARELNVIEDVNGKSV